MPSCSAQAEIARRAWEAVSVADVETLADLSTDDVAWHASGRGRRAGTYRGRLSILDYLARIGEDVQRWDSHLEDVMVGEYFTGIIFRVIGERDERRLDARFLLMLRLEGDRIAEVWAVPHDQHAVDDFWA